MVVSISPSFPGLAMALEPDQETRTRHTTELSGIGPLYGLLASIPTCLEAWPVAIFVVR